MKNLILKMIVTPILLLVLTVVPGLSFNSTVSTTEAKITAPVGTPLMVRLDETLDSRQHRAGHKFTGVLEGQIAVEGTVVAPRGAKVYGQLVDAKKSGRLVGKSEMKMSLTHILINDQLHPIMTSGVKAVTDNTAKNTVGTTGRSALIGGLIGGTSGARTGAKVGVGVSAFTRGNDINIPAGTLLDFTLATPLTP